MKKHITVSFTILLTVTFVGCAGIKPNRQFLGNNFISDYPPLQITLNPDFQEEMEDHKRGVNLWRYVYGSGNGISIAIYHHNRAHGHDYYYSLEGIAEDRNMVNLGAVRPDGHRWLKFADASSDNKWLLTGYFTRKDDDFIYVYRWSRISSNYLPVIESYKKTHNLTVHHEQLLDEAFSETNKLFKIVPKELEVIPQTVAVPKETEIGPKEVLFPYEVAVIPKEVAAPKEGIPNVVSLRETPLNKLTSNNIDDMLLKYGFFESSRNPTGTFNNNLVDNNDGTVTDMTTGLMWQRSGSDRKLSIRSARNYLENLNKNALAGYDDWRIPTMEELASLLNKNKVNNVHMDSVFNTQQYRCWSSDKAVTMHGPSDATTVWVLDYHSGKAKRSHWYDTNRSGWLGGNISLPDNYVKAVRLVKK